MVAARMLEGEVVVTEWYVLEDVDHPCIKLTAGGQIANERDGNAEQRPTVAEGESGPGLLQPYLLHVWRVDKRLLEELDGCSRRNRSHDGKKWLRKVWCTP